MTGSGSSWTVRPLDRDSWPPFADLVERNNGIYGGCWCVGFHHQPGPDAVTNRAEKRQRVRDGAAHAALVLDDDGVARGWAQFGDPAEPAGFKHRRAYAKEAVPPGPDWRIGCVFVDRSHRGRGVARAAVGGAVELIAAAGGGLVEVVSEVTRGRDAQSRFLYTATAELFEDLGFVRDRQIGKHAWVLGRTVAAA